MNAPVFILDAVIFLALALPLIFDRVPPNRYYGFRCRATRVSQREWYRLNRAFGKALALASIPVLLTGILGYATFSNSPAYAWIGLLILFLSLGLAALHTYAQIRKR